MAHTTTTISSGSEIYDCAIFVCFRTQLPTPTAMIRQL